jgi:hypothetical protein
MGRDRTSSHNGAHERHRGARGCDRKVSRHVIGLSVLGLAACASVEPTTRPEAGSCADVLRLSLGLTSRGPELGRRFVAILELTNQGKASVWLEKGDNLRLEMRDSGGRVVPAGGGPRNFDRREWGQLVEVKPGQSDVAEENLMARYVLVPGAPYSLTAFYRADSGGKRAWGRNGCAFAGTIIKSPTVYFP